MKLVIPLLNCLMICLAFAISPVQAKPIKLVTTDGVILHGQYSTPRKLTDKHPAVILIHQGGSDHSEWNFMLPSLLSKNYVVLAYDVRGHGQSDKVANMGQLFNDPTLAPKGLAAAIKYLKAKKQVDGTRIAVVGASIGGNLAAVGIANMGVKTAVCISGKTAAVFNLEGKKKLALHSIYYISSNENRGLRAEWAQELHKLTKEPHKITIVKSSEGHGVEIFKDEPNVEYQVLQWLEETL